MTRYTEIVESFFLANVKQGKYRTDQYDQYISSVICYGLAVVAQMNKGRINPDDLFKDDIIVTTEENILGKN